MHPAIIPYIDESIAASEPSALLAPNSITPTFPLVDSIILLALVACSIAPFIIDNIAVSTICASIIGALIVIRGSFGNTGVPSAIAYISPVNLKFFK